LGGQYNNPTVSLSGSTQYPVGYTEGWVDLGACVDGTGRLIPY